MRSFFNILFGGLAAIGTGLVMVWGLLQTGERLAYYFAKPADLSADLTANAAMTVVARPADVSTVSGLTRIIRYTATEEEGLIDQSARSLPAGADNRITATAYLVKDLTTDTEAAEYNQDKLLPIASLTKLVTAVVARKFIPAATRITLTKDAIDTYGNTAGFKVGETFAMSDLLYPLLMVSSNDAAEAYAHEYGRTRFIQAMNGFAQSIGAYRTVFDDPSGLSAHNQSTANDIVLILGWIRQHDPDILSITSLKSKTIRNHTWVNPTHFLSWSYYLGGKNGYTDEADRTAAALFSIGRRQDVYAIVVLGSEDRDADVVRLLDKIK